MLPYFYCPKCCKSTLDQLIPRAQITGQTCCPLSARRGQQEEPHSHTPLLPASICSRSPLCSWLAFASPIHGRGPGQGSVLLTKPGRSQGAPRAPHTHPDFCSLYVHIGTVARSVPQVCGCDTWGHGLGVNVAVLGQWLDSMEPFPTSPSPWGQTQLCVAVGVCVTQCCV